jgi:hypothetical protein
MEEIMSSKMKSIVIIVAILAVIFLGLQLWAKIYPDWLWFSSPSISLGSVFMTTLKAKIGMGLVFGVIALFIAAVNLLLLWKIGLRSFTDSVIPIGENRITLGKKLIVGVLIFGCLFLSIVLGFTAVGQWEPYLRFAKSGDISFSSIDPQNFKDPIFSKDIAYYVFKMPFLRFVRGWFFVMFFFVTIGTGAIYALRRTEGKLSLAARSHILILGAITLLLLAWGRVFAMYELLSPSISKGWVYGVGFADAMARIPVFKIMMVVAILAAVLCLVNIFVRNLTKVTIGSVILYALVAVVGVGLYPWVVQRFQVEPQEFDKESKYIENNITYTRKAYNLDKIKAKPYKGSGKLTLDEVTQNRAIMDNIRLWDWRPLRETFKQREARRPQYDFLDVDIDRYVLDGKQRQVMLSARELVFANVTKESQTWVNRTFFYTHGYGLTMSPVSEIEKGGLPRMFIDDIPPRIHDPWNQEIKRPEIYFGEGDKPFRGEVGTLPYIVVTPNDPTLQEFDYPKGEDAAYASYSGIGGVTISSFWRRLAFSLKFSADTRNILFSGKIKGNSKILINRSISECVRTIAPFLKYDKDPYLVVANGRLYWMQDAYTTTHMYPYSEPMMEEVTEVLQGKKRVTQQRVWGNYIRNSVKVVIDAYDGSVTYYLMTGEKGQEDPIAECYKKIFPSLFKDYKSMPDELKKHIRYPQSLFMIQAMKYASYHMNDSKQFYNKEDLWQFSTEKAQDGGSGEQPVEPYYVVLQLPDSNKEEFMLMLPYTPNKKKNMIAWLAAKCDPGEGSSLGDYGNLMVYNFPKGELVDGTIQVEAYIDQNPKMSQELSLWSQRGSKVIRGNLLAIPINQSILYVEPIYLEAESSPIPVLRRVVAGMSGGNLEWGETLEEALSNLFGTQMPTELVSDTQKGGTTKEPAKVTPAEIPSKDTVKKALDQYNQAQKYLKSGDWTKYGEEMDKLKQTLEMLQSERK